MCCFFFLGLGSSTIASTIAMGSPSKPESRFQSFLSCATVSISAKVRTWGTSVNMSPSKPCACCTSTAVFTSRRPCIRSICPSQINRRFLMAATRSYVRVLALASWCAVLPENLLMHLAFAPFIMAAVFSSSAQASEPYVRSEQIAAL